MLMCRTYSTMTEILSTVLKSFPGNSGARWGLRITDLKEWPREKFSDTWRKSGHAHSHIEPFSFFHSPMQSLQKRRYLGTWNGNENSCVPSLCSALINYLSFIYPSPNNTYWTTLCQALCQMLGLRTPWDSQNPRLTHVPWPIGSCALGMLFWKELDLQWNLLLGSSVWGSEPRDPRKDTPGLWKLPA